MNQLKDMQYTGYNPVQMHKTNNINYASEAKIAKPFVQSPIDAGNKIKRVSNPMIHDGEQQVVP